MEVKKMGQVFTPNKLVKQILDYAGYKKDNILKKHVIDNSCGNGAFLLEFVKRYLQAYKKKNKDLFGVEEELETYIHGIEIDFEIYNECLENLDRFIEKQHLRKIKWDILNENALNVDCYNYKMDYVIGNPPYVRVHNLEEQYNKVKNFSFSTSGMSDLFLVFFELGFKMLNKEGVLCYITPNSFYSSVAGTKFREVIQRKKNLELVVDFGHYQPFEVSTYTAITKFRQGKMFDKCKYYKYDIEKDKVRYMGLLLYSDMFIDGKIVLSKEICEFQKILNYVPSRKRVLVKNGFATLNDSIFIKDVFDFENNTIDVIKASTGQWKKCIYPYDSNGNVISFKELDLNLQKYLEENKSNLLSRSIDKKSDWYVFGRSQAIKDVFFNKFSINTTIRDVESIKLEEVPAGSGVYSGLYLLTDISFKEIKNAICSNKFIEYLKIINKCKSGGYYTYSSKDLSQYLNYQFDDYMDNKRFLEVIKKSYNTYLNTHSRSNEKLKVLHGEIARDLQRRLGDNYTLHALGFNDGKEVNIIGGYGEKNVDIAIEKNGKYLLAIGVKFIMSNYSQNSNNYFENMLGETANLQINKIPYYQIFVLPSVVPYFEDGGILKKYEHITNHNVEKYIKLSNDKSNGVHIPKKMLFYLVDFPELPKMKCKGELIEFYNNNPDYQVLNSNINYTFGEGIIYNDYNKFIEEIILSLPKN